METNFYRVEGQTDPTEITKRDGTKMNKCFVRLKELGSEYADEFYAVVLGRSARCFVFRAPTRHDVWSSGKCLCRSCRFIR